MKINIRPLEIESVELTEAEAKAVIKLIGVHNDNTRIAHGLTKEQSRLLCEMFLDNDSRNYLWEKTEC